MPIVTMTEDAKTTYYAVTEGEECRLDAVVTEYKLAESTNREYAEYALKREYQRRLTEHAYECAQLAHFVLNPPDDDDLMSNLSATDRLAEKVARDAVWLRTYDPFAGLMADVVAREEYGTGLIFGRKFDDEKVVVCAVDDDSWEASAGALHAADPSWRDELARRERVEAEEAAARRHPPEVRKVIDKALEKAIATIDRIETKAAKNHLMAMAKAKRKKTVANKTAKRKRAA